MYTNFSTDVSLSLLRSFEWMKPNIWRSNICEGATKRNASVEVCFHSFWLFVMPNHHQARLAPRLHLPLLVEFCWQKLPANTNTPSCWSSNTIIACTTWVCLWYIITSAGMVGNIVVVEDNRKGIRLFTVILHDEGLLLVLCIMKVCQSASDQPNSAV